MNEPLTLQIVRARASDIGVAVPLLEAQLRELEVRTGKNLIKNAVSGLLGDVRKGFILLARSGRATIGIAYVSFTWTLEYGGRVAWLEELYVKPQFRSRGIGGALLDAVIAAAKRRNCHAIDLEVELTHPRAANLYRRFGFAELNRQRWSLILG